jgi:hypothetical protein
VGHAGDGTNRLFIVEQHGIIKVMEPWTSTPTIFLYGAVCGTPRGLDHNRRAAGVGNTVSLTDVARARKRRYLQLWSGAP